MSWGGYGPALLVRVLFTLFSGYLVKIYAWKTILGTYGVLNMWPWCRSVSSTSRCLGCFNNPGAVVVTPRHFLTPLAVLPIYGGLSAISEIDLEAARDLGASPVRIFFTITLPIIRPKIMGAVLIAAALSLDEFIITQLHNRGRADASDHGLGDAAHLARSGHQCAGDADSASGPWMPRRWLCGWCATAADVSGH